MAGTLSRAKAREIVYTHATEMAVYVAKENVGQWFPLSLDHPHPQYKEFRATYVKCRWVWEVR